MERVVMDTEFYRDAVARMQKASADPAYLQGWIGGYLGNPKLEEQRVTAAYEAGYSDGAKHDTSKFAASEGGE